MVDLGDVVATAALLQLDPDLHRRSVVDVHPEPASVALHGDDAGREHPPPHRLALAQEGGERVGGVDPHRRQDGTDGAVVDADVSTLPVVVLGCHAVGEGELDELVAGIGHSEGSRARLIELMQ